VEFAGKRPLSPKPRAKLREVITGLLDDHDRLGSVSVVFVDDDEIQALHRAFFDDDTPTDVVTFPLQDPQLAPDSGTDDPLEDELLGEIMVSVDTARREAETRGESLERELALYSIHGVLHILGYDDKESSARRRMRRMERRYLDRFGD